MSITLRSASSAVSPGCVTIIRIILGLLLVVIMAAPLAAQVRSSRGREFRVAFLPTDGDDRVPVYSIVVSAARPTKGEIVYLSSKRSVPVDIPAANTPVTITLDTLGLVLPNATTFPISSVSIRATFNDDVTLYGLNSQRWSSDAFLGLPTESLGGEYIVLAYPNTLSANPVQSTTASDFSSQFAIVATEDGTDILIQPTVQFTSRDSWEDFTVRLNAGQVYLAQAAGLTGKDVSGTRIVASKPVVVYGGHQRANVPYTAATGRDHLVEQLPPVESWRSDAIVTPHFDIGRSVSSTDVARIISSRDSTVVTIGGVQRLLKSSGSIIEIPLDRALSITATHPILVAEYNGSSADANAVTRENDTIGDPFMMLALSPGQYDTLYSFESFNSPNFTRHFVNVVMPEEGIQNLTLDGLPLNPFYKPVPLTSYMYAQIELSPGSHTLRSSLRFGVSVYGYGPYNSYGYPAGMVFRPEPNLGVPAESTEGLGLITATALPDDRAVIEFSAASAGRVSIDLYGIDGRLARRVAVARDIELGHNRIEFSRSRLARGVYFCRVIGLRGGMSVARLLVE